MLGLAVGQYISLTQVWMDSTETQQGERYKGTNHASYIWYIYIKWNSF